MGAGLRLQHGQLDSSQRLGPSGAFHQRGIVLDDEVARACVRYRPQADHLGLGAGEHERAPQAVDAVAVANLADAGSHADSTTSCVPHKSRSVASRAVRTPSIDPPPALARRAPERSTPEPMHPSPAAPSRRVWGAVSRRTWRIRWLRSGLALAGANAGGGSIDGVLTALEATDLDFVGHAALSCCRRAIPASARFATATAFYGLRRALVLAGSETQMNQPVAGIGRKHARPRRRVLLPR